MESFGETRCKNPQKELGKQKKFKEICRMNWPDWLQEFRENLVDESILTEPWRRHFQFVS